MLNRKDLFEQLSVFNSHGRPVIVHTSLKAIGEIQGGAQALLDVLVEKFTENGGILCVPTHTWKSLHLDLNKAESCVGVLPTIAAGRNDGIRSLHPTHSMVVFGNGEKVKKFVENEINVDSPTHPDGCYGNILKEKGYILLIGVGQEKNTFIHCVEEILNIPNRLTNEGIDARITYKDGKTQTKHLRWFDPIIPDVSVNFGKFEPVFRHFGAIQDGTLGKAKVQFCSAEKIKKAIEIVYDNTNGMEILADKLPLDEKIYK